MKKTLIILAASFTVVAVGWVVLAASVLAWGGVATISVVERHGSELSVPVPMAFVEAASLAVDAGVDLQAEFDLGDWEPAVVEMLAVLDDCPDVVLVDVEDGRDHVRVAKRGGAIVIEVEDSDVDVRISLPTRSVRRTVSRLLS